MQDRDLITDIRDEIEDTARNVKLRAHKLLLHIVLNMIFLVIILSIYLSVSFTVGGWNKTWLIMVCGELCVPVFYALWNAVGARMVKDHVRMRFHIHTAVFFSTVITFLCYSVLAKNGWSSGWLLFLFMAIILTGAEVVVGYVTNNPCRRRTLLIFVPTFFISMYFILASVRILPWHPYWVIAVVGVLFDLVYFAVKLIKKINKI